MGAECLVHDRSALLLSKEKHFRLANVVLLIGIVICRSDLEHSRADKFVGNFLELISVKLPYCEVLGGHWERWVHSIYRQCAFNSFLLAEVFLIRAVDSSNPQHLLMLETEFFVLALIRFRGTFLLVVELNDRDSLLTVVGDLLGEVNLV